MTSHLAYGGYKCCGAKAEVPNKIFPRSPKLRTAAPAPAPAPFKFLVIIPSIRIRNDLTMPDPDPRVKLKCWIRIETNAALQHW